MCINFKEDRNPNRETSNATLPERLRNGVFLLKGKISSNFSSVSAPSPLGVLGTRFATTAPFENTHHANTTLS